MMGGVTYIMGWVGQIVGGVSHIVGGVIQAMDIVITWHQHHTNTDFV